MPAVSWITAEVGARMWLLAVYVAFAVPALFFGAHLGAHSGGAARPGPPAAHGVRVPPPTAPHATRAGPPAQVAVTPRRRVTGPTAATAPATVSPRPVRTHRPSASAVPSPTASPLPRPPTPRPAPTPYAPRRVPSWLPHMYRPWH